MAANPSRAPKGAALLSASATRWPEIEARGWKFMQRHHVFGVQDLQTYLSIGDEATRRMIQQFMAEGRIRVLNGGNATGHKRWVVCEDHVAPESRGTALRRQFWQCARKLRTFSPVDMMAHTTPELAATREEAAGYAAMLLRGGYLRVVQTAIPDRREPVYQLVNNTGPTPPQEKRVRAIWDANLTRYVYVEGAGRLEEAAP